MLGSSTFSETRPARWPKPWAEQDNLWNMMFHGLCFLWFCFGFCLIIFVCCSSQSRGASLNFWEAKLLLIVYHSLMFWLFVNFFFFEELISGLLPLCFGKRHNRKTQDLTVSNYCLASSLNGILYCPDHESRLRQWSCSSCIFTSFFLPVLKWTKELLYLSLTSAMILLFS